MLIPKDHLIDYTVIPDFFKTKISAGYFLPLFKFLTQKYTWFQLMMTKMFIAKMRMIMIKMMLHANESDVDMMIMTKLTKMLPKR